MDEAETQSFRQVFEKISTDLNRIAAILEAGRSLIKEMCRFAAYAWVVLIIVGAGKEVVQWQHVSAGTHCLVAQDDVFGVAELQVKTALAQALKTKDEIGVQDLISKGKAFRLPRQTTCLVLDSTRVSDSNLILWVMKDVFDFSFYSKIRVLSGDDYGKAVWIPTFALHVSPPAAEEAPKASSPASKEELLRRSMFLERLPHNKDGGIDWSQIKVVPKK